MELLTAAEISEPSAWTAAELEQDKSWEVPLDNEQVDELLSALELVKQQQLSTSEISRQNFPLYKCQAAVEQVREHLVRGRGFAILRNFPVTGIERQDVERMYWGFCAQLGVGVTQNSDASLIHYVTEGKLRPNQGTRGVGNPGAVSLHVDLADCVSLLCVRQAQDSPPSRLASSATLYNELLRRYPEALQRLATGFVWDRQGEHDEPESPTTDYLVPMFSISQGKLSCRYNRNWISKAAERRGGLAQTDRELFDLVDEITHQTCFEFDFQAGDVQFANNYTILHGRAPHHPADTESQTRLLMRIWFDIENIRPFADEAIVRYGIVRHGRLGWTAAQLREGLQGRLHQRRESDGAPVLGSSR